MPNVNNPPISIGVSGFTTQSDVTGSRAIDGTVYHNTSGKAMLVVISAAMATTYGIAAFSDATVTPTQAIASANNPGLVAAITSSITFLVLIGNYYKCTGVSCTLVTWIEYT